MNFGTAKGNGPAQRAVIAIVKAIEQERAVEKMGGGEIPQNLTITWLDPTRVRSESEPQGG